MRSLTAQMVTGFNRHEPDAIQWVFDKCYRYVADLVEITAAGSADSEDLIRDIFVGLLEHKGSFDNMGLIKKFLYSTARNICFDYAKYKQLIKTGSGGAAEYYRSLQEDSPEAQEEMVFRRELVRIATEKLPPALKQVFLLSYREALTNREIAARMGISEKTAANRKTKALKKLRLEILKITARLLFIMHFLS